MRDAHPLEREVGIGYFASGADGVGGRLRDAPEDFRVREVEGVEPEPIDADPGTYRHLVFRATLRDWDTNAFAGELERIAARRAPTVLTPHAGELGRLLGRPKVITTLLVLAGLAACATPPETPRAALAPTFEKSSVPS